MVSEQLGWNTIHKVTFSQVSQSLIPENRCLFNGIFKTCVYNSMFFSEYGKL